MRVPFEFRFENNLLDDELFIELVKRGWLYGSNPADLKVLDLQGAKKLTDRGFAAIVKCTNLEEVSLVDTGITEASFQLLANCKRLEDVSLGNAQIKGARLSTLSHLPIKFLVIRESELADEHFQAIGKMTELRVLKLLESKFDPQSIKHLRNLNKVWFMSFFNTPFDDTSATHLISLPKLRWLLLDESQIGDAGLKELLESVQISTLTLNGTPVTKEAYQKAKLQYPQKLIRYDGYED